MRVVVCEQQQLPSEISNRTSSGLLHRHVTRVVTRGTVVEESLLAPRAHNFLAAIAFDPRGGSALVGIAWVDISTGYVATKLSSREALQGDLLLHPPAELVVPVDYAEGDVQVDTEELPPSGRTPPSLALKAALDAGGGSDSLLGRLARISLVGAASRAAVVEQRWDDADAARLGSQTRDLRLDDATDDCAVAFLCADAFSSLSPALTDVLTRGTPQLPSSDVERMALGGLLTYAQWTQRGAALQLQHPVSLSMPALPSGDSVAPSSDELPAKAAAADVPSTPMPFMVIDPATRRALELTRPPNGRRRARGSLLHTLDLCRTAMGSRLLDRRLAMPLVDAALIEQRLDAVGALASAPFLCESIRVRLARIADLDRSRQRICVGRHSYKDLFAIRDGLADAWKLGALLLTGDDVAAESLSLPESTARAIEASSLLHARALGAFALSIPSALREDVVKAVLDAARVDHDAQWPRIREGRGEGVTAASQTLATCAAVLLSPLRALPSGGRDLHGSGASMALLDSLASAYTSLMDGLVAAPTPAVADAAGSGIQSVNSIGGVDDTAPLDVTALPAAGDDPEGHVAAPVAGGRKAASPGDAWYIRPGFSAELDAARALLTSASGLERDLQARLQGITGVRTLRVRRGLDERLFVEAPARALTQLQPFLHTPTESGAPLLQIERTLKSSTRFRCAEVQVR